MAPNADPAAGQAQASAAQLLGQAHGVLAAAVARARNVEQQARAELGSGHHLGDRILAAISLAAAACAQAQAETASAIEYLARVEPHGGPGSP